MFKEVLLFELFYRKNRAASYAYFGITFLIGFLGVASSVIKLGGAVGLITANAPYVICRMTLISSLLLSIITSAIMGVAVVRDFDHQMDGILFSMPVKKGDYLMGRFFGSFLTLIFINLALPLGFITGFAIGKYVPWDVAWKSQWVIPFDAWNYLQPFLLLLIPNLFATSALFFMSGALGRKPIVIYMQGILLVVLYQIANSYLRDLDSQYLAAIIDPYGIQTFLYTTRYWTPAEQNTLLLPFEGPMLYNRLLWTGIGFVALLITYRFFSFNVIRGLKNDIPAADAPPLRVSALPKVRRVLNASTYLSQTWQSSLLYFRMIAKEIPFIAIAGSGLVLFLLNASKINSIYGTGSYPTTASMLDLINNSFSLFFLIIVVFYSGELIWKERSMNFSMITDSLPVPRAVGLASKFVGLLLIFALLILLLITCGIAAQTAYGYFKFDLPLYFAGLFGSTFVNLLLLTLVSFFIQALVNDKFTGFVLCIIFYIANALLNQFGIEHELWQFGSGKLGLFSEINQYGHFITPFVWLKIHWMALSLILFVVAILFSAHGAETSMKLRWQTGKLRFTRPLLLFSAAMACIFLFSGFFIYYNTNIINRFMGSGAYKERQANYEKQLAKYRNFPQPKIVATNINVDLFPAGRDFIAEGYYYLKNKSHQPIQQIHVQGSLDDQLKLDRLIFDRDAKIREGHKEFYYTIYELSRALQPGDSLKVNFKLSFSTKGFVEGPSNTDIVFNGTFFNNTYFPGIGYDAHLELTDPDDRKKYALPKKDLLAKPGDLKERDVSTHGDDADHIRLEMIVGTSGDQTAIAPGFLQRVWKKNGRNYFHFKTPEPIRNFYSVFSGRYRVRKDQWKDVNLEIYYHPGHEFNLN
ncbi:MAG TPA: hypothetical protein VKQ08_09310, partial [Cyclobacteriaceae bacterium]|nr:hypothetical protein [Cyclobacteriaceae bacterium]